ncbi:MAG: hypothetical protein AB7F35_10620 [Acetobacteraceae bacterium]
MFILPWRALCAVLRALRWSIYGIASFWGSGWGAAVGGLAFVLLSIEPPVIPSFYVGSVFLAYFIGGVVCRIIAPSLRPSPRIPKPKTPPKPKPLPVVAGIKRRTDDPDEALIIGRLSPKLQSLLLPPVPFQRQATTAPASAENPEEATP